MLGIFKTVTVLRNFNLDWLVNGTDDEFGGGERDEVSADRDVMTGVAVEEVVEFL